MCFNSLLNKIKRIIIKVLSSYYGIQLSTIQQKVYRGVFAIFPATISNFHLKIFNYFCEVELDCLFNNREVTDHLYSAFARTNSTGHI